MPIQESRVEKAYARRHRRDGGPREYEDYVKETARKLVWTIRSTYGFPVAKGSAEAAWCWNLAERLTQRYWVLGRGAAQAVPGEH